MQWNRSALALVAMAAGCGNSSSEPSGGASASELIANVCTRNVEQGCTSLALEDCNRAFSDARNEAVRAGCGTEYDALLRCMSGPDIACGASSRDLCPDPTREFEECESASGGSSEECSAGFTPSLSDGGGVSCSIACADYGAECTGASQEGPLDCTCNSGPNSGLAFTAPDCGSALSSSVAEACR